MSKKEEKKKEEKEDEEDTKYTRSIQVQTLNVGVDITSEDKDDTLDKMKKLAEYFLDEYK